MKTVWSQTYQSLKAHNWIPVTADEDEGTLSSEVIGAKTQRLNHHLRNSSLWTMKLQIFTQLNHSQKSAFAVVFVILLPLFFPDLFQPLGRASPSMFSVTLICNFLFNSLNFEILIVTLMCEIWTKEKPNLIWGRTDFDELSLQEWIAPRPMHVSLLEGALQRQIVSTNTR